MTVYLDNAATSFPKPEAVYRAADAALRSNANPGRGGHRLALGATRLVFETRQAAAALLGARDSSRIAFTASATQALDTALFGLLEPGDRVVTTTMEHNSVTRPLRALEERGVTVVKAAADPFGFVPPEAIRQACAAAPTRLVALSHCSNVTGTLQAVEEIGPWCRREGILLLVDAAQSAGVFSLDVEALGIDLLAAPGHKGLMGPPGTGILYVREGLRLRPLLLGGTGGSSGSDLPPEEMPERLEAGTLNLPGLAGLRAGLDFLAAEGQESVRSRKVERMTQLIDGLRRISGAVLYGPLDPRFHGPVLSFNLGGRDPAEVAFLLDRDHGVAVRSGLHCAPDAHRTIGTFPRGTVRVSPGYFTTPEEIDHFLAAVAALSSHPPA